MKCHRSNRKYSLLTLRPFNATERELFWEFRCDDIIRMLNAKCIMQLFVTAIFYFDKLNETKDYGWVVGSLSTVVNGLLYLLVWIATKRFKKCYIYLTPFLYMFTRLSALLALLVALNSTEDTIV